MKKILVTGAAGFIGFHYAKRLCEAGYTVLGIDNLNDYYDVSLKEARLKILEPFDNFEFEKLDIADRTGMEKLFMSYNPDVIAHIAAQAGVRYSIDNPHIYVDSNLQGFLNVLEGARQTRAGHLIFASSSSVYGANTVVPFSEKHNVDHPISLYAATKKSNELMAHSYAHLYGLPCTGLRFFTVYGAWGRPDMAVYKFTKAIYEGRSIDVYNNGDMLRDFTYIDDIIEAMMRLVDKIPDLDSESKAPYKIYNIGNNRPEKLIDLIKFIEAETGIKAKKNMMEIQLGDVYSTYADIDALSDAIDFKPSTLLKDGIHKFVEWYKDFYQIDLEVKSKIT